MNYNKLINFVIFVGVVALCWWGLGEILKAVVVSGAVATVVKVIFVLIAGFGLLQFLSSDQPFWRRGA